MSSAEKFEITIPSKTAEGLAVQERIVNLLEAMDYSARDVFGMRLALEEALVNAMKHGNGMDPEKKVRVSCSVDSQQAHIEIEDEGEGFRPEDVPDPTDIENLEKPCGRGIMLMKAFLNVVKYSETGNLVVLEKIRSTGDENGED